MPRDPFKPLTPRKSTVSDHPKTVINRKYDLAKQGIELARHRDESAFRTAKSRKLKALHGGKAWTKLSPAQQAEMEEEVVVELERNLQEKMVRHEMDWRKIEENVSTEEKNENTRPAAQIGEIVTAEGSLEGIDDTEWITDEEETEGKKSLEPEGIVGYTGLAQGAPDLTDILKVAGQEWKKKMATLEAQAEEREKKWRDYMHEGNQLSYERV